MKRGLVAVLAVVLAGCAYWPGLPSSSGRASSASSDGDLRDGFLHGQGVGMFLGARYEGEWRDGEPHGQGVMTMPDGPHYEGEWRYGEPHGQGVLTYPDGLRMEGEWRYFSLVGQGVITSRDGFRYEGEFRDNVPHGQGVLTKPNGERYEGEWREGERQMRIRPAAPAFVVTMQRPSSITHRPARACRSALRVGFIVRRQLGGPGMRGRGGGPAVTRSRTAWRPSRG